MMEALVPLVVLTISIFVSVFLVGLVAYAVKR